MKGLVEFQQLKPVLERGAARTWKKLSVASDQGSDVVAALMALIFLFRLNLDFFPDPSHGGTNDFWNAGHMCDLKGFLYMLLLVINTPHGPWSEDTRFQQVVQNLKDTVMHTKPFDMPMFMDLFPKMLWDAGIEMSEEDDWKEVVCNQWDGLVTDSPWTRKGTKCMKSRFLGVLRHGKILKSEWHKRLYGDVSTCIELGIMECETNVARIKIKDKPQAEGKSTSQTKEPAEEAALRKACANQLAMSCVWMANEENQRRLAVLLEVGHPLSVWHTIQNAGLRNVEFAQKWVSQQIDGDFLLTCKDMFDALRPKSVMAIGFHMPRHEHPGINVCVCV